MNSAHKSGIGYILFCMSREFISEFNGILPRCIATLMLSLSICNLEVIGWVTSKLITR